MSKEKGTRLEQVEAWLRYTLKGPELQREIRKIRREEKKELERW